MLRVRSLLLASLCAAVATAALAEPAGRKGTRNYRPDGTAPATTTTAPDATLSRADKLKQCMDTWDAGTHITKSKWREICQRQIDER